MKVINTLGTRTKGNPDDGILIGAVVLWYGIASNVPYGYTICNGQNEIALNLSGRMVRGGAIAKLGTTGGAPSHVHGITVSSSSHAHSVTVNWGAAGNSGNFYDGNGVSSAAGAGHGHSGTKNSGGSSHTHTSDSTNNASNYPLYKQLYYIQRTG